MTTNILKELENCSSGTLIDKKKELKEQIDVIDEILKNRKYEMIDEMIEKFNTLFTQIFDEHLKISIYTEEDGLVFDANEECLPEISIEPMNE